MILSQIGKIAATSNGQTYFDNPIGASPSNRMALSSFLAALNHAGSLQILPSVSLDIIYLDVIWLTVIWLTVIQCGVISFGVS
jgi:hypothetical protein